MQPISSILLALLCLANPGLHSAEIRFTGSRIAYKSCVEPVRDSITLQTGHTIKASFSKASEGMPELCKGRTDVVMGSRPLVELKGALEAGMNPSSLREMCLGQSKILFVVHPANPVRSLSREQIRSILTGEVKNWAELGGQDRTILIIYDQDMENTHPAIDSQILHGGKLSATRVTYVAYPNLLARNVALHEGAIAPLPATFLNEKVSPLAGCELTESFYLFTHVDSKPWLNDVVEKLVQSHRASDPATGDGKTSNSSNATAEAAPRGGLQPAALE